MTSTGNVTRTASALMVSRLLQPAVSLLVLLAIGRRSDLLLGQYAVATTFLFVLQTLPLLGLMPFVMREAARFPDRIAPLLVTVGALAVGTAAAMNLVLQPALSLVPYDADVVAAVRLIGVGISWGILAFLVEIVLVALHQTERVVAAAVAEHASRLVASGAVLYFGGGIASLMACALLARLIPLAMLAPVALRRFRPAHPPRWSPELARGVRQVLPAFLLSTVLALVMSRCDVFVLLSFRSTVEVGHYAIAYRMLEIALIAITTVCTALFPRYAAQFREDPAANDRMVRRDMRWAVAALACAAFVCFLCADRYVALLFARQYPSPVRLAQGFGLVLAVMGFNVWLGGVLNAIDRQGAETRAQAVGAISYAGSLLWLVPLYGSVGALWAAVIAGLLQVAARLLELARTGLRLDLLNALLPLAAVAVLVFGTHYLLFADAVWYVQWAAGIVALLAYLGTVTACGWLARGAGPAPAACAPCACPPYPPTREPQ